jgi:carbamoyl-phosphate synthase small subunit
MKAVLALADGRIFEGKSFGATGEATGEVVLILPCPAIRRY